MTETIREKFIIEKTKSGSWCKDKFEDIFSLDTFKSFFPFFKWLPTYGKEHIVGDVTAGLTVALTVIPQSLAYANLAGLPVQYGLYSSFMGVFIYCFLGTSKDVTLGPTAIMSLIVSQYGIMPWYDNPDNPTDPRAAILLTFLSGIVLLLMAVFKLGFLVNYVSHAVITGFTCAAAVIISFSQLKKLLGLKNIGRHFYEAIVDVPMNLKHSRWQDFLIGASCMIILHFMKYAKGKWTEPESTDSKTKSIIRKVAWFACTARNAVVIILVTCLAYGIDPNGTGQPFTLTGKLQGGLPKPAVPEFAGKYWVTEDTKILLEYVPETTGGHHRKRRDDVLTPENILNENGTLKSIGNLTMSGNLTASVNSTVDNDEEEIGHIICEQGIEGCVEVTITAGQFMGNIMSGVFIVAIMSYVESIAIAKGFGRKNNYKVDPGQELIALGTANVISSFFSSYPVTGSFSRTAVNAQSGVMTPAGGIITGILVLIATQFLTPLFEFIPASALAAVIMLAAISMFDTDGVKHAWAVNKMDVIPLALTFFVCFYEIAIGIAVGILISLTIVLYPHARPNFEKDNVDGGKGCIIKLDRGFDFPGAEYLEDVLIQAATYGGYRWLICDMSKISHLDLGAVDALHTASEQCKRKTVCFRIVIPDEMLHKKLVNGHIDHDTISLTLGSALVQVGKATKITNGNGVEEAAITKEPEKEIRSRKLFVETPIIGSADV